MGNNASSKKKSPQSSSPSSPQKEVTLDASQRSPSKGMIRSPSGADLKEKNSTKFAPIEELVKILARKNESEGNGNGITDFIFTKYVFPHRPELGMRLFRHFHTLSHAKTKHLGVTALRQQCERFLAVLDDSKIIESYVKIFCNDEENASKEGIKALLKVSFDIAMAFYTGEGKTCPKIDETLDAIVNTCFFQDSLSVGFVARWIDENCSRLVLPVHKYVVHLLTTSYRSIKMNQEDKSTNGMELATPILEKGAPFANTFPMLTVSMAWLLAGTLPPLYSRPLTAPNAEKTASDEDNVMKDIATTTTNLPSHNLLTKIVSIVPSHWSLLYDTREHGVGANRFLHHVLGYRGPTLTLLRTKSLKDDSEKLYCIGAPQEWKETSLYTGGEDSCLIQISPKFSVMEKGVKILYLNTHIRGYPKGLRVAVDPKNPIISINEDFEKVDVHSIAHNLLDIEVWGCGDSHTRDVQLDIKKWQVKEAERQRTVKLSTADWMDHPDRYLLELSGRPQYNNSNN